MSGFDAWLESPYHRNEDIECDCVGRCEGDCVERAREQDEAECEAAEESRAQGEAERDW